MPDRTSAAIRARRAVDRSWRSPKRRRRAPASRSPSPSMRSRVSATAAAISRKPIRRSRKAATADLIGRIERGRRAAARARSACAWRSQAPGSGSRSGASKVSAPDARPGRAAAPARAAGRARRRRRRSARACPAAPAGPGSSRPAYSTRLWTIGLRVDQDLDPIGGRGEQIGGLDHLQALVHHRGGIDRNLGAHATSWDGPPPAPAWRRPWPRAASRGTARPRR